MEPSRHVDVLRDIQNLLNEGGISLASLVIAALQDPKSSMGNDLILRITDVLEALRPRLDDPLMMELGRFFASITSSELSGLKEDGLWHLPASKLSAEQLQNFSMKEMSCKIASAAPGFSSFLHAVCVRKNAMSSEAVVDDDEASVEPDWLLEIVCTLIFHINLMNADA